MVKKKSVSRRPSKKRKSKKSVRYKQRLIRSLLGVALLVFLIVAAGWLLRQQQKARPPAATPPAAVTQPEKQHLPEKKSDVFEIYPKTDVPIRPPLAAPKEIPPGERPKIAIIIDDLGEDRVIAEKFIKLEGALTFSLLPTATYQKKIAGKARQAGVEMMLHLPMEPMEYPAAKPGKGALLMSMTPDELIRQLNRNIDAVPGAKGVNNHMGSKMTAESAQIYQIFSVLKKRNLYFIDSRTTPDTICRPSARLFNLRFAQRDIFIDNIPQPDAIRKQLEKLALVAKSHGEAVGIAHPYPVTYEVLKNMLPKLREKFLLVPASEVVHHTG